MSSSWFESQRLLVDRCLFLVAGLRPCPLAVLSFCMRKNGKTIGSGMMNVSANILWDSSESETGLQKRRECTNNGCDDRRNGSKLIGSSRLTGSSKLIGSSRWTGSSKLIGSSRLIGSSKLSGSSRLIGSSSTSRSSSNNSKTSSLIRTARRAAAATSTATMMMSDRHFFFNFCEGSLRPSSHRHISLIESLINQVFIHSFATLIHVFLERHYYPTPHRCM